MASSSSGLNQLPVELFHLLFSYFSAHEILFSFTDVSGYIDSILLTYSDYRLNFHQMERGHFNLISSRLRPDQVISLILSHDDPASELFSTRFHITQFTRLRSLTLVRIHYERVTSLFANLHQLEHLRSFSFDVTAIRHRYPAWNDDYRTESKVLSDFLHQTYAKLLPRLTHLHLSSAPTLHDIPLPHLRRLKLSYCCTYQLEAIVRQIPALESLDVSLSSNTWTSDFDLSSNRWVRLDLKITGDWISMNQLEQLLVQLLHLRSLKLVVSGGNDLLDGYRWQSLTTALKVFHFQFHLLNSSPSARLPSFATPYWIEEKRWFVSCNGQYLFSTPDSIPAHISLPDQTHLWSTSADVTHICDQVTELTLSRPYTASLHSFPHVTSLKLDAQISASICSLTIDINRLVRLSIPFFDNLLGFFPLESKLPRLTELEITQPVNVKSLSPFRSHRLKQIHHLQIVVASDDGDYLVEELMRLFPSLTNLIYVSRELTMRMMIRLVDSLDMLSDAVFYTDVSFCTNETSFCRRPDLFLQSSPMRQRKQWTCQVQHTINSRLPILISWTADSQARVCFSPKSARF